MVDNTPKVGNAPRVGDIVMYVLPHGPSQGESRPGFVVQVFSTDTINIQVFTDGINDGENYAKCPMWMTSVQYDADKSLDTWHW